jgi:3-keto-5-aminohexanoate cleavage enzyme
MGSDKLIVNVALTGCVHYQHQNPALPVTPEEVGADVRRCHDAGATMFHVHARSRNGNPLWGTHNYTELVRAANEAAPGAVVVASCSGRHFKTLRERAAPLISRPKPDMASLTMGSFNFRDDASINPPQVVWLLLDEMTQKGIRPECEVFDLGHTYQIREMVEGGVLELPVYVNLFLGGPLPAEIGLLSLLVTILPEGTVWAGAGLGRAQWLANRWAISLGGHVRVGLEDSLWMDEGVPATNALMVERAVKTARAVGREPATVKETRRILGLKGESR